MLGLVTAGEDTDEIASHMVAVAILSIGLGRYLGLSRDQLYDLGFAALLHNLGMMRMPADLLHKPGKLTPEERFGARLKLAKLPRNSSPTRIRNRCEITGRPRAVYRKFKLSRLALRQLASLGALPGVVKSSW